MKFMVVKMSGRPMNFKDDRERVLWSRLYSFKLVKLMNKRQEKSDITFDDYIALCSQPCHYCGLEYHGELADLACYTVKSGRTVTDTVIKFNGLDRIDSNKGYFKDNVVPCCKFCNMAKNTMSQKEFSTWLKRTYNHYIKGASS